LSDQFSESWVENSGRWRVDGSIGSAEHGFPIRIVSDLPAVFVEKPMVIAT